jgi:hypothetical protein
MSNYRHSDKPPVPFHSMCNGMAVSMHRELKAVHEVLVSLWKGCGHPDAEHIENLIVEKINQAKEEA